MYHVRTNEAVLLAGDTVSVLSDQPQYSLELKQRPAHQSGSRCKQDDLSRWYLDELALGFHKLQAEACATALPQRPASREVLSMIGGGRVYRSVLRPKVMVRL